MLKLSPLCSLAFCYLRLLAELHDFFRSTGLVFLDFPFFIYLLFFLFDLVLISYYNYYIFFSSEYKYGLMLPIDFLLFAMLSILPNSLLSMSVKFTWYTNLPV